MDNSIQKINKNKIAIIGAGASGLYAAVSALSSGAEVTIYERNEIAGKKLLLTGNGKCNLTNVDLDLHHFSNPYFVEKIIREYNYSDVINDFEALGILSFMEKNGCFYPLSQKAASIADALLHRISMLGGKIIYQTCISEIKRVQEHKFQLKSKEREISELYDCVILCCGGKAAPKTGSDGFGFRLARSLGHTVSRTYPVLVQLVSDSRICKTCQGVRSKVIATAYINNTPIGSESGELQITEYGLSGIVIFNLSRKLTKAIEENESCQIDIDLLPSLSIDRLECFLDRRLALVKEDSIFHFLEGLTNPKIIEEILAENSISPNKMITNADRDLLLTLFKKLKSLSFKIIGHKGYENAQSTQGGILISELSENMESKFVPGLFFAGEMTDVDADCGGYNLHWAWSSAAKAGTSAAKKGVEL